MSEWGAIGFACGFAIFAVFGLILLHTIRRVLLRTEDVLGKAGHEISQLAAESKELLAQTSATLSQLKARTEEVKPFCESLKLAGESLSNTVQRADAIAQLVTDTAMERLEKARRENELRLAEAFRWLDAGLSVWQSIKRQSPSPADDDA
ncbi:DUF948 domain-containing protein [Paenibacillus sp. FSL M7-1455]|uniref:DUF948 domain-containing protein n=1 Tax=Paenibacillus cookii TaxID=157839 RepID=A0ABQ4LZX4_9BACL|nr:DUF948 domain-containing protein [Paenibacillus cookii]KHF37337.1 hypothetical protein CM49_00356 [Paenibacillus sp. P1XP2]GIO68835.1 hypothetical protein J21TS3_36560 [Paenibacillus cookii]HWO54232.1 DUF948 domain-containing protein [Paenibacillus cookii]